MPPRSVIWGVLCTRTLVVATGMRSLHLSIALALPVGHMGCSVDLCARTLVMGTGTRPVKQNELPTHTLFPPPALGGACS
eukprot:1178990-Prorocentrum_minimum.AAC.1